MATRYNNDLDSAAETIVQPVTPAGVQPPAQPPRSTRLPQETVQNVMDVRTLLADLERDPADGTKAAAVRATLDEMRSYDPSDTDPASARMVDDFCEAVETKLAAILTGGPEEDHAGVIGSPEHVGKSLGQIAAELFPELHGSGGAYPFPDRGAPGSGLANMYLAARRTKGMQR